MMKQSNQGHRTFLSPSDIGRPHYRHKNPVMAGYLYQYRQFLWDCYMVAVTTALPKILMFQVPVGGSYSTGITTAIQKTLYHTNMSQAGSLASPEKFYARSLAWSFRSDILLADAHRLNFDMLLSVQMSKRAFGEMHAFKASCGGGLQGASSGVLSNGLPIGDPKNAFVFSGALGEVVEQLQTFAVLADPTQVSDSAAATTYTTSTSGAGVNAFVHLDGLLSRAVL